MLTKTLRAHIQLHTMPFISSSSSSNTPFTFTFTFTSKLTQILPSFSPPPQTHNLHFQPHKFPISLTSFSSTPTKFFTFSTTFTPNFKTPTSSKLFGSGHLLMASFSTNSSNSGGSREILVQHLLVKENDLNLVVELQKRIAGGEDLSDLAVEYSLCPSKEDGGMLGWVRKGQMVPEFEDAAFSAPLNTVVKCKTKFGWHLLQVLSEREELVLHEIQPNELHERLKDPDFIEEAQFIDVREPDEVEKASLPCFKVLPLQQFGSWGPEITTKFDPDKDTYVMCHHGVRSLQVARWLQSQGFKKVFNVTGGIHSYAVNADPSIPTY